MVRGRNRTERDPWLGSAWRTRVLPHVLGVMHRVLDTWYLAVDSAPLGAARSLPPGRERRNATVAAPSLVVVAVPAIREHAYSTLGREASPSRDRALSFNNHLLLASNTLNNFLNNLNHCIRYIQVIYVSLYIYIFSKRIIYINKFINKFFNEYKFSR